MSTPYGATDVGQKSAQCKLHANCTIELLYCVLANGGACLLMGVEERVAHQQLGPWRTPSFCAVPTRPLPDSLLCCRDDVGDQDKWAKRFGATRIMHKSEIRPSIADIEVQLEGEGPWNLRGEQIHESDLDGGLQIVHVPGHTSGSIALWHAATKAMFTGDHLGWSERAGRVSIFERYNRFGVQKQLQSVQKLMNYDFLHVLPGHGRRFSVKDAAERLQMASTLVDIYQ
jgi:hypothetical protein